MGYTIISEQNEIRRLIERKGSKGNPDLIGIKDEEILFVEIVEPGKKFKYTIQPNWAL